MADGTDPLIRTTLSSAWPDVFDRLGARQEAFFAAARQQLQRRGVADPVAAARYINLCFAFGPAFEDRAENEWALALLADDRLGDAVKLHQLVWRAQRELERRGSDPAALRSADAALLDTLDHERRAANADAPPLSRSACDIQALEWRLLDASWRREYREAVEENSGLQLVDVAPPPPVRVDAAHPAPALLCVLTHAPGEGPPARLQARHLMHGGCEGGRHPQLRWIDEQGMVTWNGHEARAASWPVQARVQPPPGNGLGVALVEATSPAVHLLEASSCGLRDEGVPLGTVRTQVWAYPAHQWLYALQREPAAELAWPRPDDAAPSISTTRCRIERDGAARDASAWVRGFDTLAQGVSGGLDRLFDTWSRTAQQPAMRAATPSLLAGRAALAWGWREGASGLAGAPLMRLLADLDLTCAVDVALEGEIELGASRTRVRLVAQGSAPLACKIAREAEQPSLLEALAPAVVRWRWPFTIEFDPIASADGVIWREAGPCTGAISGEAGLRPRLSGGSGWQWFANLAVEPVLAPVTLHDPVLGLARRSLALLPALPLLEWSLG
jgi:hypothetical protein